MLDALLNRWWTLDRIKSFVVIKLREASTFKISGFHSTFPSSLKRVINSLQFTNLKKKSGKKAVPMMLWGWSCDIWLGKPLAGTLRKRIMVVIFQIGHSQNRVQKINTNKNLKSVFSHWLTQKERVENRQNCCWKSLKLILPFCEVQGFNKLLALRSENWSKLWNLVKNVKSQNLLETFF